jgi:hypothetical protein
LVLALLDILGGGEDEDGRWGERDELIFVSGF